MALKSSHMPLWRTWLKVEAESSKIQGGLSNRRYDRSLWSILHFFFSKFPKPKTATDSCSCPWINVSCLLLPPGWYRADPSSSSITAILLNGWTTISSTHKKCPSTITMHPPQADMSCGLQTLEYQAVYCCVWHGLRTPNEGINQRNLKICFGHI